MDPTSSTTMRSVSSSVPTASASDPSPTTTTSTPHSKRRNVKYARALGYILDLHAVYEQEVRKGTAFEGQLSRTFGAYKDRLAKHCGIKYNDIITVRNPKPYFPPVHCLVVATNLSKKSKIPRTHLIEKAKEFLETTEQPKWYYIVAA